MTPLQAVLLGLVQGLTEFLPVSSTAHLRIVPALLGWGDPGAAFSAVIQIGTLIAVLAYFRHDIRTISRAMIRREPGGRLGWMIVAGTAPIVVVGLLFKTQIETSWRSLTVISAALIGLAALLAVAEWRVRRAAAAGQPGREVAQVRWRDAIVVGLETNRASTVWQRPCLPWPWGEAAAPARRSRSPRPSRGPSHNKAVGNTPHSTRCSHR